MFHDPGALLRLASNLERFGDQDGAKAYYRKLLELSYLGHRERSLAFERLAANATSTDELRALCGQAVVEDPNNRRCSQVLQCLTEPMAERIARDPSGLLGRAFRVPLNLQLQTISRCNARCEMCPYPGSWHARNPGQMAEDCFEHMLGLVKGLPLGRICLYLENEPFLDRHLVDRLESVKRHLLFQRLDLSTNISPLTEATTRALVECLADTPHEVWVSWHGDTPEVYERVMGLDFDRSLRKLQTYLRVSGGRVRTVLRSSVGARHDRAEAIAEKKRMEAFLSAQVRAAGIDLQSSAIRIETFTHHDRAGSVQLRLKGDGKPPQESQDARLGRLKPYCDRILSWLHVLYDGSVILCCMDYQKETAPTNVMQHTSLESLFSDPGLSGLRAQALGQADSAKAFICRRCTSPGG